MPLDNPEYGPIRPDIKEALDNYAKLKYPVGHFLTAVLENDLMEAFGRADDYNRLTLFNICSYVYNELPATCWGSEVKVEAWLEQRKAERRTHGRERA